MKFTLSWLQDHLETKASLDEITEKLTAIGLTVEAVSDPARELADFTVGYVIEAKPHPDADRLRLCIVDTGDGQVQVVCGAPNARTGMKGVFARSGLTIPGTGLKLKPTQIRGEESNGMLCSMREMGLSDEHDGIIDLPEDASVGVPFAAVMGLDDPLIDIAITPNRQDCTGVRGIARDLAAAGLGSLKPLEIEEIAPTFASPISVSLYFSAENREACACFVGRYFKGVKNGPSPEWLQRRLRAIGLRPISALVDITNYVTIDLGRPLHVFDADKVHGNIHARLAKPGEELLALDGKTYHLDENITVIADDQGAEGIAGVMGGKASGCQDDTVNVFLEVAYFDPIRTAATGRRLGIESDARYRFERGVDPAMLIPGAHYASQLITRLCGGEASQMMIAGTPPLQTRVVSFRPSRVADLGGIEVTETAQQAILEDLGFEVAQNGGPWQVAVPSWRQDVHGEADLVEDIMRIVGFDTIPTVPLPPLSVVTQPALSPGQRRRADARRLLAGRGLMECVTWSFMPRRFARLFGGGAAELQLQNPISSELDAMRPSMLPNLIEACGRNRDRGHADIALFEVGPQYADASSSGQAMVAAGVRMGAAGARHWAQGPREVDVFDAKADVLALLASAGVATGAARIVKGGPDWYHPGRSGTVQLGPKNRLATFGEVHPAVLSALDVKGPMVAFEIFIENLPHPKAKASKSRSRLEVSDYPSVDRDFAFLVADQVTAETILRAARAADKKLITEAGVFDIYTGAGVEDGKKSVAISLRLEPKDRTLTEAEIDAVADKVVAAVEEATGGSLRG